MTETFKKIERQYVLSDSSVNEYGFRLLTAGYQLEAFRKNPIGYYMHRREDGIVLKWEDLRIEDDKVVATPVINLANGRGAQTCNEAENGFLNAASVGHIVVLEYSTEPDMMLPGQTGPTITKWYNKECSLVDIPGNCNALTRLYDAQENEINLADLGGNVPTIKLIQQQPLREVCKALDLAHDATDTTVVAAVTELAARNGVLDTENKVLLDDKYALQQQLDEINTLRAKNEVAALLDRALEDKKVTVELRGKLADDYANNAPGLKSLLGAMPAYRSIAEMLKASTGDKAELQWQWDDYEKNDPTGGKLKSLRAQDPVRYKELFDKKFAG
ncbi:MAG: phage protease [Bacteroidota bacterium]